MKREVGLTWCLFNLGPTLTYRRSGQRPAGEAGRMLADAERDGVAVSSVSALLSRDDLLAEAPRSEWLSATGPASTLLFADTTGWDKGGSAGTGDRLLYTCLFGSQAGTSAAGSGPRS